LKVVEHDGAHHNTAPLKNNPSFLRYRKRAPADPFHLRVTRGGAGQNPRGEFVLYWAQSARRLRANLALDFAIARANELALPVVVYEGLRSDYPSANDRIHSFVMDGMRDNAADAESRGVRYASFVPRTPAEARGVLRTLAKRARIVVTDEFPTGIIQQQTAAFRPHFVFDGNGILPMRAFEKEQYSAKFLRDRAHRLMPEMWADPPEMRPAHFFDGDLEVPASATAPAECDIDHSVERVATPGGRDAALQRLEEFVANGLAGYAAERNRSPHHVSGLSPYLHFGHVGIHEVALRIMESGAPDEDIDSFLEEAIIRRELSFNFCFYRRDHDSLSALPAWATQTLNAHRADRRKRDEDDEVWKLAHRQLLACGTIHGYLRMLWGKKLIEWSSSPEKAHRAMVDLHDRYALDGRDPNTHAGILWCFGKHDRPWFPERPVFGTIRYMSSASTAKKVRLREIEEIVRNAELAGAG
jgi:deoxyribodipyrimidine photo-lyase